MFSGFKFHHYRFFFFNFDLWIEVLIERRTIVSKYSLENKGIAFKARMACTTRYKQARDHYLSGMTRA